ncbi:serine hydrolase domain-containing protein [Formosa undariae]
MITKIDSIIKVNSNLNQKIGISVGFIKNNEEHFFNYGNLNRTDSTKISQNSIFEIGSITKLFTAHLIARQVELGKIDLDNTIDDYLPPFFELNTGLQNKIKVSDLASHQSGLPDFNFQELMEVNPKQPLNEVTKEMVDSVLMNTSNLKSYGSYQYSNISYVLLGYILENIVQDNYENIIKNNILIPLNMSKTKTLDYAGNEVTMGYNAQGELQDFFNWNSVIAPAGLLKSNATDMLKFIRLLLKPNNQAINNQLESTYFKNTFIELGLGLNILRENDTVVFAKTGDTLGQSCVLAYNPEKEWGIIILTNQANRTANEIFNQIFDILN